MQCRNCQHYLDDEFRYCPRCGAPGSLGWPAAGGPWLRRPAIVAGLAVLLVAWLAALQRQLWVSSRSQAGQSPPSLGQIAARPREALPVPGSGVLAPPVAADALVISPSRQTRSAPGELATHHRAWPGRSSARRTAVVTDAMHAPHPAPDHREAVHRGREGGAGVRSGTGGAQLRLASYQSGTGSGQLRLASYQAPLRRRPADRVASRHDWGRRARPRSPQHDVHPWAQTAVFVKSHDRYPSASVVHASNLVVNVSARPYGVKTYVYLDGGRELGIAPLRVRFERPGRHRLLFFAPTLGPHGRANRNIQVTGQSRLWVSASMGPSRELARS